jgi:hypothetical protein
MIFLNRLHRVATICGATPLFLGTAIFVAWLVTSWKWLVMAGVVMLYVGLAFVAAGVLALGLSSWTAFRTPGISRRRVWLSTLSCLGLLLANFLAADGIISAVIANATRYTVVVHNTSHERLDRVRVFGGGCDASYGSILPGATARRSFWIRQDSTLVFRASAGEKRLEQTIDGYVTTNLGGHTRVTVQPDRTISVTRGAPTDLTFFDRARGLAFWLDVSPCRDFERQIVEPDADSHGDGAVGSAGGVVEGVR